MPTGNEPCPVDLPSSEAEFISDLEPNPHPVKVLDKKRHLLETIIRYRQVKDMRLQPHDEAIQLCELELHGKQLDLAPSCPVSGF